MYQDKSDIFTLAAGAQPLAQINSINSIPQKLWMAAIQLHENGQVARDLLLDKELKPFMSVDERKAIKRGMLHDEMRIVGVLDQAIDLADHQMLQHQIWTELQTQLPSSVLQVAKDIEREGVIHHARIAGDAFWDEKGLPTISSEKLSAIRTGSVDTNDPDYQAFLGKVDVIRENMREEKQRRALFDQITTARDTLQSYEEERKTKIAAVREKIQEHTRRQVVAFADFTARADTAMREMFIDGPDAEKNQDLLSKTLNAAIALSVAAQSVPSTSTLPGVTTSITASPTYEVKPPAPSQVCSANSALFVDGSTYNFLVDDPKLCKQIMDVIPAKGKTVLLNDTMSLRANQDGSFYFRIEAHKTAAECLRNTPSKIKKSYMSMKWDDAAGPEDKSHPCLETVIKDNLISSQNMNAIVEAWLYSGGQDGKPVPITYFLSKWFLESRHGKLAGNPTTTAFGMNQFIASTWVEQIMRNGDRMGNKDLREKLLGIAAFKLGLDENEIVSSAKNMKALSRLKDVRDLHRQYTGDAHHSAIYGADYSLSGLLRLQKAFKSGEIPHPLGKGHSEVTSKMGYTCHLLGFEGCKVFLTAYGKNPDQKVRDVIKGGAFKRNAYLFRAHVYERDKGGNFILDKHGERKTRKLVNLTMREFYDYLETFGFDDKPMQGLEQYRKLGASALAQNQDLGKMTFLTVKEAKDYALKPNEQARVAIATPENPKWIRETIPGEAVRKEHPPETVQVASFAFMP